MSDYLEEYTKLAIESCIEIKQRMLGLAVLILSGKGAIPYNSNDLADVPVASALSYKFMRPSIADEDFMTTWGELFREIHKKEDSEDSK